MPSLKDTIKGKEFYDNLNLNHIATVFVGQKVLQGEYSETIDHYSILRTLEDMYGLSYAGNSATSIPITDCWIELTTEIENSEKYESFKLFPNPASESLALEFYSNREQLIKINITDVLSRTIVKINKEVHVGHNTIQVTTEKLTAGTYFVNVISAEKNRVKKVVLIK